MSRVKADVRSPVRVALIRDICELHQRGRKEEKRPNMVLAETAWGAAFLRQNVVAIVDVA